MGAVPIQDFTTAPPVLELTDEAPFAASLCSDLDRGNPKVCVERAQPRARSWVCLTRLQIMVSPVRRLARATARQRHFAWMHPSSYHPQPTYHNHNHKGARHGGVTVYVVILHPAPSPASSRGSVSRGHHTAPRYTCRRPPSAPRPSPNSDGSVITVYRSGGDVTTPQGRIRVDRRPGPRGHYQTAERLVLCTCWRYSQP